MSLASIRIAARLLVVAGLAALTAGCFQPMYAEHTDGTPGLREKLMGVEVPPVDKPNASQEARIQVEIRNALAYNLIEIASNKSVMTGATFSRVSYDIPGQLQRFARSRAFRDAEDRAAQEIAERIQTRLASFFVAGT